jgi:hypothetical protein
LNEQSIKSKQFFLCSHSTTFFTKMFWISVIFDKSMYVKFIF